MAEMTPLPDTIQYPVDEAYARGIQNMGQNGPPVSVAQWMQAVAQALGSAGLMRGGLGQFPAKHLMLLALAHAGRLGKYGA